LNARGADGQPLGTVLRLGAVYGSRLKGNYERLTHALARHRFIPIGNGLNRRTLVYDKDVGRAAALAVSHPAAAEMIDKYTEDIAVDGSLIQKELCFVPQYDLKTGWEETIREMPR
jgi:uncharacterized protein YbjT (DUF2867 family)